jgi:hypothetical protein
VENPDIAIGAIKGELRAGERIIWVGVPPHGIIIRGSDATLIPITLFWGGAALIVAIGSFTNNTPIFGKLLGLAFGLLGIYLIHGRFFVDAWRRRRTYYGVTTERIVIISGILRRNVESISLRTLGELSFSEDASGNGTIVLGPKNPWGQSYAVAQPGSRRARVPPVLERIPEVKSVYRKIIAAQQDAQQQPDS